ncbi:MAG: hypothetical protein H6741_02475 [Alphaproteobacteria bacterium]|nr:hypothetical protein [Alphaproteobacteria bacterium]MCB9791570.1 hypothetical protein [Alphaproteobacteria bacterium]
MEKQDSLGLSLFESAFQEESAGLFEPETDEVRLNGKALAKLLQPSLPPQPAPVLPLPAHAVTAPVPQAPEEPQDNHLPRLLLRQGQEEEKADPPSSRSAVPDSVLSFLTRCAGSEVPVYVQMEAETGELTHLLLGRGRVLTVHCDPHPSNIDTLLELLRRDSDVDEESYRWALQRHAETGTPYELLLADRVYQPKLAAALLGLNRRLLAHALSHRKLTLRSSHGAERLRALLPVPQEAAPMLFRALLTALEEYEQKDLTKGMRAYQTRYVAKRDPAPYDPALLRLSGADARFWETSLEHPVTLTHLFKMSSLSAPKTWRMLYAMLFTGLLVMRSDYRPPNEELLRPVISRLHRMNNMTAFEILESHWTSLPEEIEAGYRKVREFWASREAPAGVEEEYEAYREEIVQKIDKAWRFLRDDGRRRDYREKRYERTQLISSADLYIDQSKMEIFRKDWEAAELLVRRACDLVPDSAEYRMALAKVKARRR